MGGCYGGWVVKNGSTPVSSEEFCGAIVPANSIFFGHRRRARARVCASSALALLEPQVAPWAGLVTGSSWLEDLAVAVV